MLPPHVAVVYDSVSYTPLRVYVNTDMEDGAHMFTIKPGPGESISVIPKSDVRGLQLRDIAAKAILKKTGVSI